MRKFFPTTILTLLFCSAFAQDAVVFSPDKQMFGLTPNNLTDVPAFETDFMKQVPTTWDETLYIDGYPGKYCILARRHDNRWYVGGVNAGKDALKLKAKLPMLAGKKVHMYGDNESKVPYVKEAKVKKNGELEIEMQPGGGMVLAPAK